MLGIAAMMASDGSSNPVAAIVVAMPAEPPAAPVFMHHDSHCQAAGGKAEVGDGMSGARQW